MTVYWGGRVNNPNPHWDTHFNNNRRLKEELLPPFDQCFSAFLDDLAPRGLLETTLVLAMGEFGRTPRFGQFTGNGVNETGPRPLGGVLFPGDRGRRAGRRPHAGPVRPLRRLSRRRPLPAAGPVRRRVLHALGVNPRQRCATLSAATCRSARQGQEVSVRTGKVNGFLRKGEGRGFSPARGSCRGCRAASRTWRPSPGPPSWPISPPPASVLGLTQAAVSQRLQALEKLLGVPLFTRTGAATCC